MTGEHILQDGRNYFSNEIIEYDILRKKPIPLLKIRNKIQIIKNRYYSVI